MQSFTLFDILLLGMGVYVLYSGISGKGKLYNVENLKEGYEEKFKKVMRILFTTVGAYMSLNSVCSVVKGALYSYEVTSGTASEAGAVYECVLKEGLEKWGWLSAMLLDVLTYVFMGISLVVIVLMVVAIRKMTDKNAPRKENPAAAEQAQRQAGHSLPVSAFDFDDNGDADAAHDADGASDDTSSAQ